MTSDALKKEIKKSNNGKKNSIKKKKTTKIHSNLTKGVTKKIKIRSEEMTQANLSALVGMQPMHKAMISFIEI